MSTDNRTMLNDCESGTGWTGDDTATPDSTAGFFFEGSNSLTTQLSNVDEQMSTTQESVGAGTFSLDWTDTTVYLLVKDNLNAARSVGGVKIVIGDGSNLIGYSVGGYDDPGLPLEFFFYCYKLDVSDRVTTPGGFTNFTGTEAGLVQSTITTVGYGCIHSAKAQGSIDNVKMDAIRYIANGSYAITVNGGTVGTPETMADLQADDLTGGWGVITNPQGLQYTVFAPIEWGNSTATADHYFEASSEQWFLSGGEVGTGNFPCRVIGNATDTGSFVINNVVIVSTGTSADFDCSSTNMNTLEIDSCSFTGLSTFSSPTFGGTSRFCTNTIFATCGQVTHNGADISGSSILSSTVALNTSALLYNLAADPNGEMDNMTFSKGAADHHAIEFGLTSPLDITITGCDFSGFSASQDVNASTFHVKRTTGTVTINLVGCTSDVAFTTSYRTDGATVVIVADPVTLKVVVTDTDGVVIEDTTNAGTLLLNPFVFVEADTGGPLSVGTDIIKGITDTNGEIQDVRTYASDQPIKGWVRRASISPYYKQSNIVGTISSTAGLTLEIQLISDGIDEV